MTRRSVLLSSLVLAAAGIRVAGQRCERGTDGTIELGREQFPTLQN
jgi:hypothetical protein